jgi:hypothetical protein
MSSSVFNGSRHGDAAPPSSDFPWICGQDLYMIVKKYYSIKQDKKIVTYQT